MRVLVLGASYGALLGCKLTMAGHDATLVCLPDEAQLINEKGYEVRIKLRGEEAHRAIRSADQPGRLDAVTPAEAQPQDYDLVALAMQEPQYSAPEIRALLGRVAAAEKPCMSIMNMPPLPYLARIPGLDVGALRGCFADATAWDVMDPALMTLCSPDPQAFRPPEEPLNVLQVGLPTNFKAARFESPEHTAILERLAADIDAVRLDGKEVPVKLRVHDSVFVPLAKWAMLLTGNYRCVTRGEARSIRDAVHSDLAQSAEIYAWVQGVVRELGADPADEVPFEKYAKAAESLLKPSSAARAIYGGARQIERVDKLVQQIAATQGKRLDAVDETVAIVDAKLSENRAPAHA